MFVESLDGRHLMDALPRPAGVDASFGKSGVVTFPAAFFSPGYSLADDYPTKTLIGGPDGSTFVSGRGVKSAGAIGRNLLLKLDRHGNADKTFGTKGYVALPAEATRLAFDPYEGYVYVGMNAVSYALGADAATPKLSVMRLTAHGKIDTSFAKDGTFSYLPGTADGETAESSVEAINPLPGGAVLLGVDRSTTRDTTTEPTLYKTSVSEQSLALFRLRADGTRDPKYGKKGMVQVLGGTVHTTDMVQLSETSIGVKHGFFADVETSKDGKADVLIRYEAGGGGGSTFDTPYLSPDANAGKFSIKARSYLPDGTEQTDRAGSWTVADTTDGPADETVKVLYAGYDGSLRVQTVVQTTEQANASAPAHVKTERFANVIGRPSDGKGFSFAGEGMGTITSVSHSAGAAKYVISDGTHLQGLTKDFRIDRSFADRGNALVFGDQRFYTSDFDAPVIDDLGRVYAVSTFDYAQNLLYRFA